MKSFIQKQDQWLIFSKLTQLNLTALLLASLIVSAVFTSTVYANQKTMKDMPEAKVLSDKEKQKVTGDRDPNAHADGYNYRNMAGWEESDQISISKVMIDQFEYRHANNSENYLRWDTQGWQGTDYNKLWLKFEGKQQAKFSTGDMELQALYSHSISAFWDAQIGGRVDYSYSDGENISRYFGVLGVQGLAPYWFEMEPAIFISSKGELSARLVASYDLLITQKWVLQPRFEMNVSANDLPEYGIGKGVNDVQIDLRLRYEFKREIAPYFGMTWTKKIGSTADYANLANEAELETAIIAGVKIWF